MRPQPAARNACTTRRPILPAPTTNAVSLSVTGVRATACSAMDTGSTIAACSNEIVSGRR